MVCSCRGGEIKGHFLFVLMGEIITHLCDAGRESLGKLTSNIPEREEKSWTNIL